MFKIVKSIDVHFAHVVHGHSGLCLGPHGHTWKFEVCVGSETLDKESFVCDFGHVKKHLLQPIHDLLDHGFAIGHLDYLATRAPFTQIGEHMARTREEVHGVDQAATIQASLDFKHQQMLETAVVGTGFRDARLVQLGSCKMVVFDWAPTSERLAKWTFDHLATVCSACDNSDGHTVRPIWARVYETLQPVQSYAEYSL